VVYGRKKMLVGERRVKRKRGRTKIYE